MDIWIIDDNPLHLALIEAVCRECNIKFITFSTFKEFVSRIEDFDSSSIPKVVLIDLVLEEGKRGENVLKILKDRFKNKKVRFIAFTADLISEKTLKELGFDGVIFKPLTKEKLEKVLIKTLKEC